ncbi:MAG: Unknown protein [uncultured Sulfurovum sp.]|uniref:Uncharacterized protein n=1 Tax=uncultured Sulfurovum sp. TaxID=269237 RepID=A0A6S6SGR6_9BACT|nr:MAG: Unknown protein [uncultured Sulfurovum sp.]
MKMDKLLAVERNFLNEKRMRVPKFRMSETNLTYLNLKAERSILSRSKLFEKILLEVIFFYLPEEQIFWVKGKPRKRAKWKKEYRKYKKSPSFSMSPCVLNILERTKDTRQITFTLLVDEIFYLYRKKYPLMI